MIITAHGELGHRDPAATVNRTNRRPEIQGLRAIAVVAVVLFHLWSNRFPGGYVGVDIFFAISGYLIIGHLLREIDRTGSIKPAAFWARRARRLLPASLLVLLATGIGVVAFVPVVLWEQWFQEIAASAAYVENWVLAANSVDYLGAANTASPTQHYWSLSVEEQFYILWPILILLTIAVTRALSARARRRIIVIVLAVVSAASFGYSVVEVAVNPDPAYFDTGARSWEFGLGGLLAASGSALFANRMRLRAAASWIGLVALAATVFLYQPSTPFPGATALLPVVATLLVIWARAPEVVWSPVRVLALRPVQWLGDISYSLYLWHWPFIVLVPIELGHALGSIDKAIILVVAVLLAWLTKRFVEDPVRTGPLLATRRPLWTFVALVVATGVIFAGSGVAYGQASQQSAAAARNIKHQIASLKGCIGAAATEPGSTCPRPYAVTVLTSPAFARNDIGRGVQVTDPCKISRTSIQVVTCDVGDTTDPTTRIALVGDSHAGQYLDPLDAYGKKHHLEFVSYLKTLCAGTGAADVGGGTPLDSSTVRSCATWGARVIRQVAADPSISAAIFTNYTAEYSEKPIVGRRITAADFTAAWSKLAVAGKTVIAIRDVPGTNNKLIPSCIAESIHQYDPCTTARDVALPSVTADPMMSAAASDPAVKLIDLSSIFCDAQKCHSLIGGLVVYFDSNHMTATFAKTLSGYLGAKVVADLPSGKQ